MTHALFYDNPYLGKFTSRVTQCVPAKNGQFWVWLEDSAFYPEGGGQPGDKGRFLFGKQIVGVLDTRERESLPAHLTKTAIPVGTEVRGEIDWETRFRRMQNHSGEHIVSGILCGRYGANNVGFHMGQDAVQVDFDIEFTQKQLSEAERDANEAVFKNLPIEAVIYENGLPKRTSYRCKKELKGAVRLVRVPGYDACACCGLHVGHTGEIGMIRLLRWERYKGGTRIWMVSGWDALEVFRLHSSQVYGVSAETSAKPHEIVGAVSRLKHELEQRKQTGNRWRTLYFQMLAKQTENDGSRVLHVEEGLTADEVRLLAIEMAGNSREAVVFSPRESGYVHLISVASPVGDARETLTDIGARFVVKGGGRKNFAQGTVEGEIEDIIRFAQGLG